MKTAERVPHETQVYNYVFQRCLFAYHESQKFLHGKVFEIGTGSGYGAEYIAPQCDEFVTVDKFESGVDFSMMKNVKFIKMEVPPFHDIPSNQFDFVICYQVIEHIEADVEFVSEIQRILKPGGQAVFTTPNIKTSLARNPWHVREYTDDQLYQLLKKYFTSVQKDGVFGNQTVNNYVEENRKKVNQIMRWDIFKLQYILPASWLKVPYDLLNSWNRKKIASEHQDLSSSIHVTDFFRKTYQDDALDLFFIATK